MSWGCKFISLCMLQVVLLFWDVFHTSQLANDLKDGNHIQSVIVSSLFLLINVALICGQLTFCSLPAFVWMACYSINLIHACFRTLSSGRPYWTAGISYSASNQVSRWFNLSCSNYDVALILDVFHFFLVCLWVICMQRYGRESWEEVEEFFSRTADRGDMVRMDDLQFTNIQGSSSSVNSNRIEIRITEPRGNSYQPNHHQPPAYSEVELPPNRLSMTQVV